MSKFFSGLPKTEGCREVERGCTKAMKLEVKRETIHLGRY